MKSIVTGATGFLGSALVELLAETHGPESVVGLVWKSVSERERPAAMRLHRMGVRLLSCDLMSYPVVEAPDLACDVLYHLAAETDSGAPPERLAVNTQGTRNLLQTLGGRLREGRVVLSGATAAIDRGRRPRALMKETDPPCPRTAYGRSKLESERILEEVAGEHGFAWTVARFSPVWTADPLTGFLGAFRDQVAARSFLRKVPWPGSVTMIHRDDAVRILRHLGETGAADGMAVHVGDGNVYAYTDLIRDLRRLSGETGGFLPIRWLLRLIGWFSWLPLVRRFVPWRLSCLLGSDLAVDNARLREVYPEPLRTWDEGKDGIRFDRG
jgi:nucleoside-diphosphate-sugar epimerase